MGLTVLTEEGKAEAGQVRSKRRVGEWLFNAFMAIHFVILVSRTEFVPTWRTDKQSHIQGE
jgi:hypothetical protein